VPQGTLAERIRAGGFGLGRILTPTGVGTPVEEGERRIEVKGKDYLLALARSACCRRMRLSISSGRSSSRISRHQTLKA